MLAADCVIRCSDVGVRVVYATNPRKVVNFGELSDLCVVKR